MLANTLELPVKDGTHFQMSDAAFYNCPLKPCDWLKRKNGLLFCFGAVDKGLLWQNDQVRLVTSRLLRCNDSQFIDMSAYLLSNLIMEKCFLWRIMWYPNRMNVKADV